MLETAESEMETKQTEEEDRGQLAMMKFDITADDGWWNEDDTADEDRKREKGIPHSNQFR